MLKPSLAMLVISAIAAANSFAAPHFGSPQFLKEQMFKIKSSNNPAQNNQSRFNGKWAGVCDFGQNSNQIRLQIEDNGTFFNIIDLDDHGSQEYSYNVAAQENYSNSEWYYNHTGRFTKVDDNTRKYEGTGVGGEQLSSFPPSEKNQNHRFANSMYNVIYSINNNQLIIDTHLKVYMDLNKQDEKSLKCVLNRTG